MNLEELPAPVKRDIEDQSLEILEQIKDDIIVIGGWGVRAHLGEGHHRYTLDVDGVTDPDTFGRLKERSRWMGLGNSGSEWGYLFHKPYEPKVSVPDLARGDIARIEIQIEVSGPRIPEKHTPHYFEFSLTNFEWRSINFHDQERRITVKVPPIEDMAAVKLGLPVDYKNDHDVAMLLRQSDMDRVIRSIQKNDDWSSMVLRRMPRLKGRIKDKNRPEYALALVAELDIEEHIRRLEYIEKELEKKR